MKHSSFALIAALLPLTACSDGGGAAEEPVGSIVEAGKADDFLSMSAREYWIEGTTRIVLDGSWANKSEAERMKEVKRLIPYRQIVIGWFLNQYIVDKEKEGGYGGFQALTKNGSYEDLRIKKVSETTYSFDFRHEVGGQEDLIAALPDAKALGNGAWSFDLWIGKISTADMQKLEIDAEWYRQAPWGEFDPSKVPANQKEIQPLRITQQPSEDDAWIDLDRVMADGKLTIGLHFGWDYHGAYHEKHSKEVYTWLVTKKGFKSPVGKWEDLRHDAGPLKGKVTWRGKTVNVEISIFWGRKGDATDPDTAAGGKQLEADMLTSLKSREIVIFSGHSGAFYGFALANWKVTSEGDLDDVELARVELWKDHYQIILAEGCETYALGQAFADNPSKPGLKDLDVITTTTFSNAESAGTVIEFIAVLIGRAGKTSAVPTRYSGLLETLDGDSDWFGSMYGVHGIDDNPHVHPWADLGKACRTCSTHASCGEGMRCVKMKDGKKGCAAECTSSVGCGAGYECRNVTLDGYLTTPVCAPTSLQCGVAAPAAGRLIINEVLPNPDEDMNEDGELDTGDDEYVELVNAGAQPLDIAGWSLADGTNVRHRFPTGSVIPPGGALLVFGGGEPELTAGTTLVQVASTGALGLNNTGDSVKLADKDGLVVAVVSWLNDVSAGKSWARAKDLDATASFGLQAPSPGTRADGSQF